MDDSENNWSSSGDSCWRPTPPPPNQLFACRLLLAARFAILADCDYFKRAKKQGVQDVTQGAESKVPRPFREVKRQCGRFNGQAWSFSPWVHDGHRDGVDIATRRAMRKRESHLYDQETRWENLGRYHADKATFGILLKTVCMQSKQDIILEQQKQRQDRIEKTKIIKRIPPV